jgi:hypothetical protein
MPNRYIREGINSSRAVASLDVATEVFYRRMLLVIDDFGRYEVDYLLIRSAAYPVHPDIEETDIARWLAACQKAGLLAFYESGGRQKHNKMKQNQTTRFAEGEDKRTRKTSAKNDCQAATFLVPFHPLSGKAAQVFGCAVSSVVEHYLDTVGVGGSKPPPRTIFSREINGFESSVKISGKLRLVTIVVFRCLTTTRVHRFWPARRIICQNHNFAFIIM